MKLYFGELLSSREEENDLNGFVLHYKEQWAGVTNHKLIEIKWIERDGLKSPAKVNFSSLNEGGVRANIK